MRRGMLLGALIGALLGGAYFFLVETSLSNPAGCDGLLMGAIHCIFLPLFGFLIAMGAGALAGVFVGVVVAAIRGS